MIVEIAGSVSPWSTGMPAPRWRGTIRRFGMPSCVEESKEHTRTWQWEAGEHSFCVTFVDGIATQIY